MQGIDFAKLYKVVFGYFLEVKLPILFTRHIIV
jgi:hypothetical protein